jgi:hypothetical protein
MGQLGKKNKTRSKEEMCVTGAKTTKIFSLSLSFFIRS